MLHKALGNLSPLSGSNTRITMENSVSSSSFTFTWIPLIKTRAPISSKQNFFHIIDYFYAAFFQAYKLRKVQTCSNSSGGSFFRAETAATGAV